MSDYCKCDDPECEQEHEPWPADVEAWFKAKIEIQKLPSKYAPKLPHGEMFEVGVVLSQLAHEAFRIGLEAGKVRA